MSEASSDPWAHGLGSPVRRGKYWEFEKSISRRLPEVQPVLEAAWRSKRWNKQELSRCVASHWSSIHRRLQGNWVVGATSGTLAKEEKTGEQVGTASTFPFRSSFQYFLEGRPRLTNLPRLDGDGSFTSQLMWSGQKTQLVNTKSGQKTQFTQNLTAIQTFQCGGFLGQTLGVEHCALLVQLPLSPSWYVNTV